MRRLLLALIVLSVTWALIVAFTGGIDLRPSQIPFKSTDADRPTYAALILIALYVAAFRSHIRGDALAIEQAARQAAGTVRQRAAVVAFAAAMFTFGVGMYYGVLVAGGSDSYGYVSQSKLWLAGDLITEQPIATQVTWPDADATFAPLGYRPAPDRPGAIVPSYAPGLAVLMALGTLVAGAECGPFLIVPLLSAWLVWLTYRLGARVASPLTGATAAVLMATSPAFLFMVLNPMSDVPVSTFFLAGLVVALSEGKWRAFWTGVVVSVGIFVRPNLVPIGAVFLLLVIARAPAGRRWHDIVWFGLGGLPCIAAVAAANAHMYGAPWRSGYGSLDQYYAWGYFLTNLRRFSAWLLTTETPYIFLWVVPVVLLWRADRERRIAIGFLALFIVSAWLAYVFYTPYDAWWYLRFLLPAFPPMLVLATIAAARLIARIAGAQRVAAIGVVLVVPFLGLRITEVRDQGVFALWRGGIVYASAGEYARTQLPENAVILTVQHSGSIRYYANRLTIRWDQLDPAWWDRALAELVAHGYRPYVLISSFEEEQFRARFKFSTALDSPGTLIATMTTPEEFRVYDPLRQMPGLAVTVPMVVACPCTPGGP